MQKLHSKQDSNSILYYFEPSLELVNKGIVLLEAAVAVDFVVMVLKNHRCEPIELEKGLVLSTLCRCVCSELGSTDLSLLQLTQVIVHLLMVQTQKLDLTLAQTRRA